MADRRGERMGWVGGWLGGFCWVAILAIVFLVRGDATEGVAGLVVFAVSVAAQLLGAPWRHPESRYWKLMLPLYGLLVIAVVWAIWSFGGLDETWTWWTLLMLVPVLMPLLTIGRMRWVDGER